MKLALRAPPKEQAIAWLEARAPGPESWDAALALAAGAPLRALEFPAQAVAELDREMRHTLQQLAEQRIDVTMVADSWMRSDPVPRLIWLENWITRRVEAALGGRDSLQSAEPVRLPAALLKPKIRPLFELLDAARELRRLTSTGLNQQLALEALLLGGRAALAK
jgi:hypothetical protein